MQIADVRQQGFFFGQSLLLALGFHRRHFFDELLQAAHIVISPVTEDQARIARDAYRDFGKGSGHPAALNLGDCFAYALAKAVGEPLLFKGDGFRQTDVEGAI